MSLASILDKNMSRRDKKNVGQRGGAVGVVQGTEGLLREDSDSLLMKEVIWGFSL